VCVGLNFGSAEDDSNECLFRRQYYNRNIEELKNILKEFVQFANKQEEYKPRRFKD